MSPAPVPRATDATYIATPASTPIDTTRLHRTLTDIVCHSSISELFLGHRTILLTNQLLKRSSLMRAVDGAVAFLGWCSGDVTSRGPTSGASGDRCLRVVVRSLGRGAVSARAAGRQEAGPLRRGVRR